MEIIIDTNFAITCTKQKIDFFNLVCQIVDEQVIWILPNLIIDEINKISKLKGKRTEDRQSAKMFLELLELHKTAKTEIREIILKIENVDDALVDYCRKHPNNVLATLDKKLKSRINNNILTIKGKKFLHIVKT